MALNEQKNDKSLKHIEYDDEIPKDQAKNLHIG